MEVLTTIEWSERGPRWRGQGYLYGYPDYAVDFFVESGEAEARGGAFVPRDPIRVPTFGATPERSNFVWTVPRVTSRTTRTGRSFDRAAQILAAYTERRVRYIGAGKPGAFALAERLVLRRRRGTVLRAARLQVIDQRLQHARVRGVRVGERLQVIRLGNLRLLPRPVERRLASRRSRRCRAGSIRTA